MDFIIFDTIDHVNIALGMLLGAFVWILEAANVDNDVGIPVGTLLGTLVGLYFFFKMLSHLNFINESSAFIKVKNQTYLSKSVNWS